MNTADSFCVIPPFPPSGQFTELWKIKKSIVQTFTVALLYFNFFWFSEENYQNTSIILETRSERHTCDNEDLRNSLYHYIPGNLTKFLQKISCNFKIIKIKVIDLIT